LNYGDGEECYKHNGQVE